MMKISFLASHGGSSARHIIATINTKILQGFEVGCVITNNKDAAIYLWCLENNIEVLHISGKTHPENEDLAIKQALKSINTDIVVLSGYMKKIGVLTLSTFKNKILNIHPALLPKYGGHKMYGNFIHKAILVATEKVSGATVHLVDKKYDTGAIILQKQVAVLSDDTVDTLGARVRAVEPELYVDALIKWQKNNFRVADVE